jgi:tRNA-Thr(GGU) m(6)t(6)A37 methyltransferase TsaA
MSEFDTTKLGMLLDYMLNHGREHVAENERWLEKVKDLGLFAVAGKLEEVSRLEEKTNLLIEEAMALLGGEKGAAVTEDHGAASHHSHLPQGSEHPYDETVGHLHIQLHSIGTIRTPYKDHAPRQPQPDAEGDFRIVLDERWADGLYMLEKFKYLNVLFYLDRSSNDVVTRVTPPSVPMKVGLFASRSPKRPNHIALSVVKIKKISGNTIFISGIDALDKTPLLDIKPYIGAVDCKPDAGNGWIDELLDSDHHISHLKGESHSH